uniref:DUF3782 domain-containing protein n=1 Tax=Candidatus Kentrum sp. LFY TaxID=2126342 RepID=A0A450UT56_9GAMM|nr:MAG: hypothetical protein BECKLFY1418B_GA0070995_10738 [Candidatus Kentron sp. LFY]
MSMSTQEPSPESVWAYLQKLARQTEETGRFVKETTEQMRETDRLIKETGKQMQETDRKMQETDRKMQETDRFIKETTEQMQETDRRMKETDRLIKETGKQMQETDRRLKKAEDLFTTQWGRLIESLVSGSLIEIFNGKGIPVDDVSTRVRGNRQGHSYEFDIIAHNGREIIIVEVKTTLRPDDVREFMNKLDNAKTWMPRYQDNVIYGAMAWLQTNAGAERMAENRGLFSIRAVGDSASLTNATDFNPRAF